MIPSVDEIDNALRTLEDARSRLTSSAEGARALIDGLSAALHIRAVQLAAMLLPRPDDAVLDDIARSLAAPELAAAAFKQRVRDRALELTNTPRAVTKEQLRAAESGRAQVEKSAAEMRAEVMRIERDPDVVAAIEAQTSKGGGLRGMFAKKAPKTVRALGGINVDDALAALEKKRNELRSIEDDARAAAAEVAQLRRAFVRASDAEAALRALPVEALTAARATVADLVAKSNASTLRPLLSTTLGPRGARELAEMELLRAKHRYAATTAAFCIEQPHVELVEVIGDAQRWRDGIVSGGLPVPEREFVDAKISETATRVNTNVDRWNTIAARLDSFVLGDRDVDADVLWWDVIFNDAPDRDDGAFVEEVRVARARRAVPREVPAPLALELDDVAAASPDTTTPDAPLPAPFSSLSGEAIDTGKWIEQFYGKPLALDGFMPTSHEPHRTRVDRAFDDTAAERTVTDVGGRVQRVIGPYTLLRQLGAGGMAEVHLAQDQTTKKRLVVKLIQRAHANDPEYVAMFEREARIGIELVHENIVRTHELVDVDHERLLVLEYVEGVSVQRLCTKLRERGSWPPKNVAALLAMDAASGLAYAHAKPMKEGVGVVHRDISPDNLLADTSGVVKVADFGIARSARDSTLTRTGELKGKLPYMAPELFEGESASPSSDVFALGVSLYWLLTGKRPFGGPTEGGTIHAIMTSSPPPPGALSDGIAPEIDVLVMEMLTKHKAERPTATTVRDALSPFAVGARPELAKLVKSAM